MLYSVQIMEMFTGEILYHYWTRINKLQRKSLHRNLLKILIRILLMSKRSM